MTDDAHPPPPDASPRPPAPESAEVTEPVVDQPSPPATEPPDPGAADQPGASGPEVAGGPARPPEEGSPTDREPTTEDGPAGTSGPSPAPAPDAVSGAGERAERGVEPPVEGGTGDDATGDAGGADRAATTGGATSESEAPVGRGPSATDPDTGGAAVAEVAAELEAPPQPPDEAAPATVDAVEEPPAPAPIDPPAAPQAAPADPSALVVAPPERGRVRPPDPSVPAARPVTPAAETVAPPTEARSDQSGGPPASDLGRPAPEAETERQGADRSRSRRWVLVPLVLLVVGLAGAAVALRSERAPAVAEALGGPRVVTPLLSARRVPEVVAAPVARRRLVMGLDAMMGGLPATSCMVVRGPAGVLYDHNASESLIPASNQKLNTAFAVLTELDPASTFTTSAVADAGPVGGVVAGNLFLVGGGDPLLMTDEYVIRLKRQPQIQTDFESLADKIVQAGVRTVTGSVVGDETRYDTLRTVAVWPPRLNDQAGPLSALMVNDGSAVVPGAAAGTLVPAADPAAHAASVLTGLLQARGVTVAGAATSGKAPEGAAPVAAIDSPPLATVVAEMLQESDNTTAELLVKELGLQKGGAPTTEAGVAVVREALTEAGIPIDGVDIADGSGLAENDDHVTCASLTAVLAAAGSESELAKGLPVAGQSGTLEDRFGRTAANGRLAAKTGTLNGVTALSGFASPPAGPPLAFAIVANRDEGRLTPEQLRTVDQMAVILMSFPDSPDLAALGPEPPA